MGVVLSLKSHDMSLERQTSAVAHLGKVLTAYLDRIPGQDIRSVGVRMALVLAMVAATTAVIVALVGVVDLRHVLAVYFIPVLAATLRWGFAEGLAATFASALAAAFFFYDPIFSFYIANPTEIVSLLIFAAAAIVIGYLVAERRAAQPQQPEDNVPVTSAASRVVRAVDPPAIDASAGAGTVPERVKEFIAHAGEATYCDGCIQDRLGLKWRQQVQLITATLAVTKSFKRAQGPCFACNEVKQVIHAVRRE